MTPSHPCPLRRQPSPCTKSIFLRSVPSGVCGCESACMHEGCESACMHQGCESALWVHVFGNRKVCGDDDFGSQGLWHRT